MRFVRALKLAPAGCALLALALNTAAAQDDAAARKSINQQRLSVEAGFVDQERACQGRFAITACVDEARRERRNALAELRRQASSLDEAQRKQRAERRRVTIRENLVRDEAEQLELARRPVREPRMVPIERPAVPDAENAKPGRSAAPRPTQPRPAASAPAPLSPAARQAQEARSRASFEAQQREAEEHRLQVLKRNAANALKRDPAAPLPLETKP